MNSSFPDLIVIFLSDIKRSFLYALVKLGTLSFRCGTGFEKKAKNGPEKAFCKKSKIIH